jgi:hypothetical protein
MGDDIKPVHVYFQEQQKKVFILKEVLELLLKEGNELEQGLVPGKAVDLGGDEVDLLALDLRAPEEQIPQGVEVLQRLEVPLVAAVQLEHALVERVVLLAARHQLLGLAGGELHQY